MPNNLCIIPARGGSKRIPRKNIRAFLGKPIIAYSIEAALNSNLFAEVMVSTDDEEIAGIAKQYGAKVPFYRTENAANDFATTFDVVKEVLDCYQQDNIQFDNINCLYPCAPFVTAEKLNESYRLLLKKQCGTVFPVVAFSFPIQRALVLQEEGNTVYKYPENALMRSQDLEPCYHDAGQYYWMRKDTVLEEKKIIASDAASIILSEFEVQDIDNETDWKMAELKYALLNNNNE